MKRIFLVEDDKTIARNLALLLRSEGFKVIHAGSQKEAVSMFDNTSFDLALVDISLPDGNGFAVCTEIRQTQDVPVIFLTASADEASVVTGLNMGAEDYITKPFNMQIFLRRVEVAVRRGNKVTAASADRWTDGFLLLDFGALTAVRGGEKLSITPNEYKLLKALTENAGNIITRQLLLERLWDCDGNFVDDHTLTVTMNRLRAKIENDDHTYIKTIRGMGYIWTGGKQ